MAFSNFVKWCQEHSLISNPNHKRSLTPPSFINPQLQSSFFTLPIEIRIIIYRIIFGDRSIHYERDWVDEKKNKWFTYAYVCFASCERVDWDDCAGHQRGALDSVKYWGMFFDANLLFSCWKAYVECLPILYANEFRFLKQRELCTTFPNQVPAAGLASVRRITLWWTLGNSLQPHTSVQNKTKSDLLWSALQSKYTALTHIRIFIDSAYLAPIKVMPRGISGDAQEKEKQLIQDAWLEGLEAMVEATKDLEVLEVHSYVKVCWILRERVKPWLKEKEEERRANNCAVRYKAYKCRSTAIKWGGCHGESYDGVLTDISDTSSHIGIEDAKSKPAEFWLKKVREAKNQK